MSTLTAGDLVRIPPHSLEAERAVLGAAMQDNASLLLLMETLQADDFFSPQHQVIYRAIASLFSQARNPDLITVDAELSSTGALEGIGGRDYLIAVVSAVPSFLFIQ